MESIQFSRSQVSSFVASRPLPVPRESPSPADAESLRQVIESGRLEVEKELFEAGSVRPPKKRTRTEPDRDSSAGILLDLEATSRVSLDRGSQVNQRQNQLNRSRGTDPLVVAPAGAEIRFSKKNPVDFDLDADGVTETIPWLGEGAAFLAIDRNRNGKIDDGSELFGDQNGAENGFEELKKLDANGDGCIDAADPAHRDLLLFRPGEIPDSSRVPDSISLGYRPVDEARGALEGAYPIARCEGRSTGGGPVQVVDYIIDRLA